MSRQKYREQDLLVRILTRDFGKITTRAISARKQGAKLSGHLEPFIESDLFIARSKTIDIVAGSNTVQSNARLRQSIAHNAMIGFFANLVDKLTQESDADIGVYEHVRDTLTWFNDHEATAVVLYASLLQLAALLGYHVEWYDCHNCKKRVQAVGVKYHYKLWSVECGDCTTHDHTSPLSAESIKALRFMSEHRYDDVARLAITQESWREIDNVVRSIFRYHLDSNMPSENVFLQMLSTTKS